MKAEIHEIAPEEIMALLDGELSVDREAAVSRHLEECATCKEIRQPMRATSAALAAWVLPVRSGDAHFESRLFDVARDVRYAEVATGVRQFAPFFRRHWLLTAATSALAAGIALTLSSSGLHLARPISSAKAQSEAADGSGFGMGRADSEPITDQQDKNFTNRLPSAPEVSGDSNGLVHGLGDHAQNSLSDGDTVGAKFRQLELEGKDHSRWLQNGPMIARTVSLTIVAKDFGVARTSLDGILAKHHGYAASLSASTEQNSARSLQASLRVPAAELGAAMAELKSLGRVQNESQNCEEVTQQHADLVARLNNSRKTEARLQDILRNRTGKISDVLAVEQEIARVRGEIEQMGAERTGLEHRVDFATLELNLSEEYKAQLGTPVPSISTHFHNATVKGLRSALETVVSIALFFAEVGPSMVIWLIVILPVGWFFWRRWRRSYGLASSASL